MELTYKFKIEQEVDVMDSWELPLFSGKVKNRRIIYSSYTQQYVIQYLVGAYDTIFEEYQLRSKNEVVS